MELFNYNSNTQTNQLFKACSFVLSVSLSELLHFPWDWVRVAAHENKNPSRSDVQFILQEPEIYAFLQPKRKD